MNLIKWILGGHIYKRKKLFYFPKEIQNENFKLKDSDDRHLRFIQFSINQGPKGCK